jgi:hypothetical protein
MPAMCDERERLIGYVYEECGARERGEIERHLEACGTCREEIAALRRVRQDLLAWQVPDHGSVWRPFAPVRMTPWWREAPAWSLAAAATLVFLLGAAGGLVTNTAVAREPVSIVAFPSTGVDLRAVEGPTPAERAAIDAARLSDMERRIINLMRQELHQRVQLTSARPPAPAGAEDAALAKQVTELAGESEWQMKLIRTLLSDLLNQKATIDAQIQSLANRVDAIAMAQQAGGGGGR